MTRLKKFVCITASMVMGLGSAVAQSSSDFGNIDMLLTDNVLNETANRYSSVLLSFQPEYATQLGFTSSNDKLTSRSSQQSAQTLTALQSVQESLKQINKNHLSPSKQVDYELLRQALDNSVRQEEQNRFSQDPLYYTESLDAIYDLILNPALPILRKQRDLTARLNMLPAVAEQAEKNLTEVSPFLAQLAMEKAYYAYLSADEWKQVLVQTHALDQDVLNRVNTVVYNAKQAVRKMFDHFKQLSQQESYRDFRLGQQNYFQLLQMRYQWKEQKTAKFLEGLNKQVDAAQKALTQALEPFLEQADAQEVTVVDEKNAAQTQPITPAKPKAKKKKSKKLAPRNAQDFYAAAKPFMTAEMVENPLEILTQEAQDAQQFLIEKGTLPHTTGTFSIAELPQYYAYTEPYIFVAPFGSGNKPLFLWRVPTGNQTTRQDLFNQDFNLPTRKLVISQELVPGKYYQTQQSAATSLIRKLYPNQSLQNGWVSYAKRLAHQKGYLGLDEDLLFLTWDEYQQALAAWVDAKLHTRQYSYNDAMTYLTQTHGLTEEHATRMLKQIATHPGKAVSYQIGLTALENAHRNFSKKYGKKFNEADFNAKLFQVGNVPPDLLEKELQRLYKCDKEMKKLAK